MEHGNVHEKKGKVCCFSELNTSEEKKEGTPCQLKNKFANLCKGFLTFFLAARSSETGPERGFGAK
jgi:hypothetical protein